MVATNTSSVSDAVPQHDVEAARRRPRSMRRSTPSTARSSQVAFAARRRAHEMRADHRRHASATPPSRSTMAKASVTENSRNSRPTTPPMNSSGMNAAISEMLIETTVKPICRAPSMRGAQRRHALLQIAEHVLDHHDGVVDHEADRDRERHQREVVDREAGHPHQRAGAGERQRHGDAGGDGRRRRGAGTGTPPASPARWWRPA